MPFTFVVFHRKPQWLYMSTNGSHLQESPLALVLGEQLLVRLQARNHTVYAWLFKNCLKSIVAHPRSLVRAVAVRQASLCVFFFRDIASSLDPNNTGKYDLARISSKGSNVQLPLSQLIATVLLASSYCVSNIEPAIPMIAGWLSAHYVKINSKHVHFSHTHFDPNLYLDIYTH